MPFRIDSDLRIFYEGSGLFELLNPFGLLCGLVSAAMLADHGAIYLTLQHRWRGPGARHGFSMIGAVATAYCSRWRASGYGLGIDGYAITSTVVTDGPSNPLLKNVVRAPGQWFANYTATFG